MPAAAVIPAPIAYIKVVAVKKLVVGSREVLVRSPGHRRSPPRLHCRELPTGGGASQGALFAELSFLGEPCESSRRCP